MAADGPIFKRWLPAHVQELRGMHSRGMTVPAIALKAGRTEKAIEARLYKLGLKPLWPAPPVKDPTP